MQDWEAELAAKGRSNRGLNNLENNQAEQKNLVEAARWNIQRQDWGVLLGKKKYHTRTGTLTSVERDGDITDHLTVQELSIQHWEWIP